MLKYAKRLLGGSAPDPVDAAMDARPPGGTTGPSRDAPPVHLFHIAYSPATWANIPPGAQALKNFTSRSDWREYWPIRTFLLNERLDEEAFYGFFSPRLQEKTGLTYEAMARFIQDSPADCDICLFSPFPELSAFFPNVFDQFEFMFPGAEAVCQAFFRHAGLEVDLRNLVMDAHQTVFSNYFAARPRFWRAWLDLNEKLFAVCEGADSPLKRTLNAPTRYAGDVQYKVFIMERTASLLLTLDGRWRTRAFNTFYLLGEFPEQAVLCQALKSAMRQQHAPEYRQMYDHTRRGVFGDRWEQVPGRIL